MLESHVRYINFGPTSQSPISPKFGIFPLVHRMANREGNCRFEILKIGPVEEKSTDVQNKKPHHHHHRAPFEHFQRHMLAKRAVQLCNNVEQTLQILWVCPNCWQKQIFNSTPTFFWQTSTLKIWAWHIYLETESVASCFVLYTWPKHECWTRTLFLSSHDNQTQTKTHKTTSWQVETDKTKTK